MMAFAITFQKLEETELLWYIKCTYPWAWWFITLRLLKFTELEESMNLYVYLLSSPL